MVGTSHRRSQALFLEMKGSNNSKICIKNQSKPGLLDLICACFNNKKSVSKEPPSHETHSLSEALTGTMGSI